MARILYATLYFVATIGLAGCGSGPKVVTADPSKPAPEEPPADGFVPKNSPPK